MRALALLLVVILGGTTAYAQCNSNASSCVTCHETQGLRPVIRGTQPWHVGHGFGDLCVSCHGGERAELDKERSHAGLRQPMSDTALSCGGCHPGDTAARVERYVAQARAAVQAAPPAVPREHSPVANVVLGLSCVGLAGVLGVLIKRRGLPREPLRCGLRDALWNPVLAGALLGAVVAVSEVFFSRPVGVSGAFDTLAAYVGRELFPHSQYYAYLMKPGITVQVWLVIGLFVGSFAASALSGQLSWRWLPDAQWSSRWGRLGVAFFSAVLVQFGAAIAGGCTSGQAISGGAAMAPAAFIFMAGMFAGGIPAAWLWSRRRRS